MIKNQELKTQRPKISVIVPVYNVEEFLNQSMDSLLSQTLKDIEVVCVDDVSDDKSLDILNDYAKKDSRIKILTSEKNQGPGVARNRALDVASGEYIMFLDPDDWLENDACELLYERIKTTETNVCFFNFTFHFFDKNDKPCTSVSRRLKTFKDVIDEPQIDIEKIENFVIASASVWTQIYKKSYLEEINARFSETRSCEDNPFFFNILCNTPCVSVLNKSLYNYRLRKNNQIPYYVKHYRDVIKNKHAAYEIILNSDKKNLLNMFVPYYWGSLATSHLKNLTKYDKRFEPRAVHELHKIALQLDRNHDMKIHKNRMDYKLFRIYLKSNSFIEFKIRYAIHWFLKRIYSFRKSQTHDITLLFGFKIKIRRKDDI